tara:strand:+ start:226 stop:666 length:441 start_codon:yes stop_codon:yes gene_type:complete
MRLLEHPNRLNRFMDHEAAISEDIMREKNILSSLVEHNILSVLVKNVLFYISLLTKNILQYITLTQYKVETSKFFIEFRDELGLLLSGALIFVAALSWRDLFKTGMEALLSYITTSKIYSTFLYTMLTTVLAIFVTIYLKPKSHKK